ncbi:MAG: winged helix family two component transcriptional regulator [Candidatus Peribacteria bacterium]|nr:winged helix family two component transcriptional regulator [Candidatus Peribacteria bacterium]
MVLKSKKALPAKKKTARHALAQVKPAVATGAKNILICDDDPALSRVMALKFSSSGFNVTVCHDGQQAITAMKDMKFDGIILDLIMPEKTGFDVLQERPHTKNVTTPTFVMSDMRTQETADQVIAMGATNFFIKMQMPLSEVINEITRATS